MAATAKNYQIGKAPKKIILLGNKTKPESAQHIIEFPGGAVEVTRLDDGSYWAHLIVNGTGFSPAQIPGEVVDSRIDTKTGIQDIPNASGLSQIAVLIRPVKDF